MGDDVVILCPTCGGDLLESPDSNHIAECRCCDSTMWCASATESIVSVEFGPHGAYVEHRNDGVILSSASSPNPRDKNTGQRKESIGYGDEWEFLDAVRRIVAAKVLSS